MAKILEDLIIKIPKSVLKKGVVMLSLEEYKKMVPTYYLEGKEAEELDKLVEEGLREYREGKCKKRESL